MIETRKNCSLKEGDIFIFFENFILIKRFRKGFKAVKICESICHSAVQKLVFYLILTHALPKIQSSMG